MRDVLTISYTTGEQLVISQDVTPDPSKSYITRDYRTVVPNDYDSPSDKGWYEVVDGSYVPSSDDEPDPEKEYYEYTVMDVVPASGDNPSTLGWIEVGSGDELTSLSHAVSLVNRPVEQAVVLDSSNEDTL